MNVSGMNLLHVTMISCVYMCRKEVGKKITVYEMDSCLFGSDFIAYTTNHIFDINIGWDDKHSFNKYVSVMVPFSYCFSFPTFCALFSCIFHLPLITDDPAYSHVVAGVQRAIDFHM